MIAGMAALVGAVQTNCDIADARHARDVSLCTYLLDPVDWADDTRIALEERASLSPDALTGMEASLRFGGAEIIYVDAEVKHLVQGSVIDTRTLVNLTEERIEKLTAIDFGALPVKDAFTIVRGDGKRKLAVFEDPNCGYCKRFEADLQKVNNVTIHMFLLPILGKDSMEKSKNIWCAKDRAKAWTDWMLRDIMPPAATCDTSALTRNVELSKKYKITGTPTLVFADGSRVPGAISAAQLEKLLADAKP